jgi:pimeloyl-ACP methyl ester carboxylesterase
MLAGTQFEPMLQEVNRRVGAVIGLLQSGEDEAGAKLFVETVAWHPGAWDDELTREMREVFTNNAPTFLDEAHDPDWQRIDLDQLSAFEAPALLTKGTISPPFFAAIVDTIGAALPQFRIKTIESAGHSPHQTTTDDFIALIRQFVEAVRV